MVETRDDDENRGWLRAVTVSGLRSPWPSVSTAYPLIDRAGRLLGEDVTNPWLPSRRSFSYDGAARLEHGPAAELAYDDGGRPIRRSSIGTADCVTG